MKYLVIIVALLAFCNNAEAHHRHHGHGHHHRHIVHNSAQIVSNSFFGRLQQPQEQVQLSKHTRYTSSEGVIGGRPSGCPNAYCGCGASLYKFGRIIPELNLAWNWARKFPHISPSEAGNGDAAVRPGHVAIVLENLGGGNYKLHDSNSGGHLTRVHIRHLVGYVFVRPTSA